MRKFTIIVAGIILAWSSSNMVRGAEAFRLSSPDLPQGEPIPEMFAGNESGCTGGNQSPALTWSDPPTGTKSFAVTIYDPYTPPASGWWHWIVYDLPSSTRQLARGAGAAGGAALPNGAKHGLVDGDTPQPYYHGPCPDVGDRPHRYVFTVYALSVDHLDLPPTATAADVDYVASSKALAKAQFVRSRAR